MSRPCLSFGLVAALLLAGCGGDQPQVPTASNPASYTGIGVTAETARLEGVARRLALALGDSTFRARMYAQLQSSAYPEGKLHLQRTFQVANRTALRSMARLNGESESVTDSALRATRALEVYLPVPAHRAQWKGDTRLLVATADRDGDIPVAYDLKGGRHLLDPTRPPQTPVLAVVPVETDFDLPPVRSLVTCVPTADDGCGGGGGGGGGGGSLVAEPGLYMTRAHFDDDFEGWLKGSSEFEIHIMGQRGATDSLVKYQCAGEHRSSPYYWDGENTWSGTVMLFSQTGINAYHAAHPGETFRIVAMEDDDTSCEMRVDPNRWKTFVATIGPLYRDITGATDSGTTRKWVVAGKSLEKLLSALASWIKTNDDLIGNAIEDKVVGEFHTGYNWILRADDNITHGWIKLEMR
ncbi:MAG TPA: hypothetical protein VH879_07870 [Gemmatimonadales bacterium]|jgi:hypothetical protein